ncbi:MAG: hypothetical protein ACXWAB_10995 [Methylobacter sp.]
MSILKSVLERKNDLSEGEIRTEILKLANATKDELKLAELLDYGNKDDYKVLYMKIDVIKEARTLAN